MKRTGEGYARLLVTDALGVVGLLAYGWWASNIRPFSALAYLTIGLATALFVGRAALLRQRAVEVSRAALRRRSAGLVALVVVGAIALEIAAIALGGHSKSVPTVSSVIDRAERIHLWRTVLFELWLVTGVTFWRAGARAVRHPL